jgi:hypothetical protein
MTELEERLRRFAEEGARQAYPPGVAAAVRRGRLRRRRLVGAVGLALVVLLAGGLGVQDLLRPSSIQPVAPAPPQPVAPAPPRTLPPVICVRGVCVAIGGSLPSLPGVEPVPGRVIAQGTQPGYRWQLVVRRKKLAHNQREVVSIFQRDDVDSPGADLGALEPVTLSLLTPSKQYPVVSGIVTDRAVRVRLWLERDGRALVPVEARVIDGGREFPENFFVAFVPQGSVLRDVVLVDRRGHPICQQQFSKRSALGADPASKADRCF